MSMATSRMTAFLSKEEEQRLAAMIPVIAAAAENSRSAVDVEGATDSRHYSINYENHQR